MLNLVAAHNLFLWMLPLAGLPILFHLFLRVRKHTRPFPSLMFFHQADPRMRARRRIREWLTLLLRILAILMLLLALARPVWLGGKGSGPVAAVLIIDNSGSMSAPDPTGQTKLSRALEATAALLGDMHASDTAALVLLVDDLAAALPNGLTADRDALRDALARIHETEASGSPARALATAASLLEHCSASRLEIHLFSDLQDAEWGHAPSASPNIPLGAALAVHKIDTPAETKLPNVALGELALPRRRLLAGRHYDIAVSVRNTSDLDAPIRIAATTDNAQPTITRLDVPARATRTAPVALETRTPGIGWMSVEIQGDGFAADNAAYILYEAFDRQPALFAGSETDFGLLPAAMSPSGDGLLSGLRPVYNPAAIAPSDLTNTPSPAIVVYPWHRLASATESERTAIQTYVRAGGTLLALPAVAARVAAPSLPDWLGATPQPRTTVERGLPILVFDAAAPVWDELRDDAGNVRFGHIHALEFYPLAPAAGAAGATALAGLEDGRPLFIRQPLGAGSIFVSGVAFDPTWTTLPLKPAFLAIVQGMALLRTDASTATHPLLVAGDRYHAPGAPTTPLHISSVAGSALDWRGNARNTPVLPRRGVYIVKAGDDAATGAPAAATAPPTYIAVRASDREGRAVFVSGRTVPALGDTAHSVSTYSDRETFLSRVRRRRTGLDLYVPLVLLALLAAALEGLVANPVPRKLEAVS